MTMAFFHALILFAFAAYGAAAPTSGPALPLNDPFYKVPDDITNFSPGAIIRQRRPPSPIAAFGVSPVNLEDTWQLLYRTNDNHGKATATVLTVLVPHNADYTKLLSYQVAQDAAYANCAPSYALQFASATSGFLGTIVTQAELLLIEAALYQGWVVALPDHEGPQGAFLANIQAGQATLDGIRAALNSRNTTGLSENPVITMWGYSGGSLASASAAELQPSYAPELRIVGAALGGTVPSIPPVIEATSGTALAGLIPTGMQGLAHQYPEIAQLLDEQILPEFKQMFEDVKSQCFVPNILDFFNKEVPPMFKDASVIGQEPAASILAANALGNHAPKMPLFVYKSTADQVSPVGETDALVKSYCSGGTVVTYNRDIISEHGSMAITGATSALAWLIDRMEGVSTPTKCSTKTVLSSILDPRALALFGETILTSLGALLGNPVGPVIIG
jgi:hypothetical protein